MMVMREEDVTLLIYSNNDLHVSRCVAAVQRVHSTNPSPHTIEPYNKAGTAALLPHRQHGNLGAAAAHAGPEISRLFRHHDDTLNFRH
jgi:hypothetical protein